MAAEIYVISGFLGAGKTTLIKKLLSEAFQKEKTVLIENDFGEVSVDAALLKSSGVQVKEMNSGCICCSLSGDFVKSLLEILERYSPDKIIIEPSGVGKLSDVVTACSDPRIRKLAVIKAKVTVVDVKRCHTYFENFGEFFEDQIQHADSILLSRTENYPDKIGGARDLIKSIKDQAAVLSKPWAQLTAGEILSAQPPRPSSTVSYEARHTHHEDHGHEDCGHCHTADDAFDTVTIRTSRKFTPEELRACINALEHKLSGTVLRAKGIIPCAGGYMDLQYVPGDLKITKCGISGDMLNVIGKNLNKQELLRLFSGE